MGKMKKLDGRLEKHIDRLMERYPVLESCREDIIGAYLIMEECYERDGKMMIAGNGGSAADSEHIAGELMKRFQTPRPVSPEFAEKLRAIDPVRGENLAKNLAFKVKRTKRPVSLEPMNPYERRIIHSALQGDRYVVTHSEGDEPFRRVVITLKR